jgi:2-methylaconitate cis-trans-isomerase PrpF
MAVTGAQCIASSVMTPGTVADGIGQGLTGESPEVVRIEHPAGDIEVTVSFDRTADGISLRAPGPVRTARLLARGEVMVPASVWRGRA